MIKNHIAKAWSFIKTNYKGIVLGTNTLLIVAGFLYVNDKVNTLTYRQSDNQYNTDYRLDQLNNKIEDEVNSVLDIMSEHDGTDKQPHYYNTSEYRPNYPPLENRCPPLGSQLVIDEECTD